MKQMGQTFKRPFHRNVEPLLALENSKGLTPSAIDSDSIEPLSVLHSKLKFEWYTVHTYPGKFYIQKTRAISNFSSQGY